MEANPFRKLTQTKEKIKYQFKREVMIIRIPNKLVKKLQNLKINN